MATYGGQFTLTLIPSLHLQFPGVVILPCNAPIRPLTSLEDLSGHPAASMTGNCAVEPVILAFL